mgnify:CR=1 FL=1
MASVERGHTVVHHASFSFSSGENRVSLLQVTASSMAPNPGKPWFSPIGRVGGSTGNSAHVGITLGASRRGTIKSHPQ